MSSEELELEKVRQEKKIEMDKMKSIIVIIITVVVVTCWYFVNYSCYLLLFCKLYLSLVVIKYSFNFSAL